MKIKDEFKGCKVLYKNSTIIVSDIDPKRFKYYESIGLSYLFEDTPKAIKYKAVVLDGPIPEPKDEETE